MGNNIDTEDNVSMALQSTTPPVPSSAASKVFGVAEPLERILLYLDDTGVRGRLLWNAPIGNLFTFLRVNRFFKHTIEGSTPLRRIMRLEFPTDDINDPEGIKTDGRDQMGLDLLFAGTYLRTCNALNFYPLLPPAIHVQLDPSRRTRILLEWYIDEQGQVSGREISSSLSSEVLPKQTEKLERATRKRHFGPEASWRKMKLSEGPNLVDVQFSFGHSRQHSFLGKRGCFGMLASFNTETALLGDLYDSAMSAIKDVKRDEMSLFTEYVEVAVKIRDIINPWMVRRRQRDPATELRALAESCGFREFISAHVASCKRWTGGACVVCCALELEADGRLAPVVADILA